MACSAAPLELDQLDAAMLAGQCSRAVRCGLVSSVEACVTYAGTLPPSSFPAAIAAGHLEFDSEQAQRCMTARAALSCDLTSREFRVVPPGCRSMFRGRVADGAACASDEQCISGRCDQGVCPEGVCCIGMCGVTRDSGAAGAPCDRSTECTDGFCDTDHTCHPLGALNATCSRDDQCDYGLACVSPSPSLPGECKPLPHIGDACPYQRCADAGAVCNQAGRCVALGLPGAPCAQTQDCSPYLECDVTRQMCAERPTLGMPCTTYCAGDSYCDVGQSGALTCLALMANGTPCDDSGTCANHNCKPGPVFDSCQDYPICP